MTTYNRPIQKIAKSIVGYLFRFYNRPILRAYFGCAYREPVNFLLDFSESVKKPDKFDLETSHDIVFGQKTAISGIENAKLRHLVSAGEKLLVAFG